MANGSVVNYISRSELLDRFIEQLIVICNYSAGESSDILSKRQITIYIDLQQDFKEFCFARSEFIRHGKFFLISYSKNYSDAILLIDPEIFTLNQQVLIDIALSIIGSIKYVMLVATGIWSPAHCALVEINGKGALICAPGGTGKSTCASRLPTPHRTLAEDCALIMKSDDGFIAQSMPTWSSVISEYVKNENIRFDCTVFVPLAGVFFLEQSSIDAVKQLNSPTTLGYINSTFNDHMRWFLHNLNSENAKMLRMNIFNLAEQLTATLPAYRLSATLNGNFWDMMEDVM